MLQTSWRFELKQTMPATLEAIEDFMERFKQWRQVKEFNKDFFAIELVLREALTNAVVHGSGLNPVKRVECVLRLRADRLTMLVRDQGSGFNWRTRADFEAEGDHTSGRGMEILKTFATRVRFNASGNAVAMVKRIQ